MRRAVDKINSARGATEPYGGAAARRNPSGSTTERGGARPLHPAERPTTREIRREATFSLPHPSRRLVSLRSAIPTLYCSLRSPFGRLGSRPFLTRRRPWWGGRGDSNQYRGCCPRALSEVSVTSTAWSERRVRHAERPSRPINLPAR